MDFPVPFSGRHVKRENEMLGIGRTSDALSGSTSSTATGLSLGGMVRSKTVSNVGGGGGTNGGAVHLSWAGFAKEENVGKEKLAKTTSTAEAILRSEGLVISTHGSAGGEKSVCKQEKKSAINISVSSTSSSASDLSTASTWTSTKNALLVKEGGHVDDDEEVWEDGVEQLPDVSGVIVKNDAGSTQFDASVSFW
jgi:hypothetical protein